MKQNRDEPQLPKYIVRHSDFKECEHNRFNQEIIHFIVIFVKQKFY